MTSLLETAVAKMSLAGQEEHEEKTKECVPTQHERPETIKAIAIESPHKIVVATCPFPSFNVPGKGDLQHGAIIKVIASAICGTDLHVYCGRVSAKHGMTLGHEIFGEVLQIGSQVLHIKQGQLVLLPFNIGCGTCDHCKQTAVQACQSKTVNPQQTGGMYGYPAAGDWEGGQAQYLLVPWADFNCFQVEPAAIQGKLASITLMSDVLPTALHAVENAGVTVGHTVYIAGAGPIGLSCAHFCLLKGASAVIIGDVNVDRLYKAKEMGCLTLDCGQVSVENLNQEIFKMTGFQYVDCAIDAVGFGSAAQGHGHHHQEHHKHSNRAAAINSCVTACSPGGKLAIPGMYLPDRSQVQEKVPQQPGPVNFDLSTVFMKGIHIEAGYTPCAPYLPYLYKSIIFGRTDVTKFLNIRVIPIEQAPQAYENFYKGENVKYIIDPNGLFNKYNGGSA